MTEQNFLKELDAKLWKAANKLLPSLDAAVYKHVVLGLVFVKYVSDSFKIRRAELKKAFSDASNEYFLGDDTDEEIIAEELENRDYYTEKNIFWIPQAARWEYIQDYIRLGVGAPMPLGGEFKGAGKLIDDAMELIEKDNPKLKRILNKNYAQLQIEQTKLADLLDLIASIPFSHDLLQSKDILGHVYEYFLGMFAAAEGKKGGQFYTPKSIVNLIVEMVKPYEGRVYDPAMGSGGFFISSEKFIEEHQGKIGNISVYGQESNPTTWRLAAMNMAIRGIDFNFGKEPAGSFINDQHPDLRADFVLANPPFNQNEDQWWDASLDGDARWVYGTPPKGNGNYGWMQHMLYHTSPNGVVGLVLANGSLSTNTGGEDVIRKNIVKADLVEAIVALPSQLFSNTPIPACIWILNKNKAQKGKTLFINASGVGHMVSGKQKVFSNEDTQSLVDTFHSWRSGVNYKDITGQYYSATTDEIAKQNYILTPGRYVGVANVEDDVVPLAEKLATLTVTLGKQFEESARLESEIKKNLMGFGRDL
jgi:type I restriction enzyme M protein